MKSSLKGAYLSGLVYPGLGQIVQKHYVRGIALVGIVTASLWAFLLTASRELTSLLAHIESGTADYDITTVLQETSRLSAGRDQVTMNISSTLIVCCWAIGIVDAYLSGKAIDARKGA
jgi:hypothetical protein